LFYFRFKFEQQLFDSELRQEAEKLVKESGFTQAIDFFNIFTIGKVPSVRNLVR